MPALESAPYLKPCPFCGCEMESKWDRKNPSARCPTTDCLGGKLPILALDVSEQVDAWNTRHAPASQIRSGREESVAIIRKALEQGAMLAVHHRYANPAAYQEQLDKLALQLAATLPEQPAPSHPDDLAVDNFAAAMKAKMAKQRAKGYTGWNDPEKCPTERLQTMLADHLGKGDPVDVGNFAMMLWTREGNTTPPAQPSAPLTNCRHCGGPDDVVCGGQCELATPPAQPSPVLSAGPITPEMAKWGEVEKAELVSVIAKHPALGDQAPKKS